MRKNNTGKAPLQNIISIFLQIQIDGQIHIITGSSFRGIHFLDNLAQIIHQHLLRSLFTLESRLHRFLNSRFSNHITGFVIAAGAVVFIELILRDHSRITDDSCHILRIIVFAKRVCLNLHPRKFIFTLRDSGNAFTAYIGSHRDRRGLRITVHVKIIPHGHDLQRIFHGITVGDLKHASGTSRSVCSHTKIFVDFLRRRIQPFFRLFFFISCQIIHIGDSVNILLKSSQRASGFRKNELALSIDFKRKIILNLIAVCFQKLYEIINNFISDFIF